MNKEIDDYVIRKYGEMKKELELMDANSNEYKELEERKNLYGGFIEKIKGACNNGL